MGIPADERQIIEKQLRDGRRAYLDNPYAKKALMVDVAAVTLCRLAEVALELDVPIGQVIDRAIEEYFRGRDRR